MSEIIYQQWDFVQADDPAADAIQYCHDTPDAAGRELCRLRQQQEENERLKEAVPKAFCEGCCGDNKAADRLCDADETERAHCQA